MEAPGGFEPPHRSFADCSLSHLGTAPRWPLYRGMSTNSTDAKPLTLSSSPQERGKTCEEAGYG